MAELVQELTSEYLVGEFEEPSEGVGNINAMLTDAMQNEKSATARSAAKRVKRFTEEEKEVVIADSKILSADEVKGEDLPDVVVMASGNLRLVYGTNRSERATIEEIDAIFPKMLEGLVSHEGIGFVMVQSEEHGLVVIGPSGRNYLTKERIEGEDPLKLFGSRAAQHLIREDTYPNCPDILVNSFYNAETDEVAAFEELIGCHGGMGGYQTQPIVLHPMELPTDDDALIGAAAVHHLMKSWVSNTNGKGRGKDE